MHRDDAVEREERSYLTRRACAFFLSRAARIGGGGKEDDDVAPPFPTTAHYGFPTRRGIPEQQVGFPASRSTSSPLRTWANTFRRTGPGGRLVSIFVIHQKRARGRIATLTHDSRVFSRIRRIRGSAKLPAGEKPALETATGNWFCLIR